MPGPRRLFLAVAVLALGVALGVPAALGHGVGDLEDQKARIEDKISSLRGDIEAAKAKEGVLTEVIAAQTHRIRSLEDDIALLNAKVAKLEGELTEHRAELARLSDLYRYQTRRLRLLTAQHAEAQRRLEARLVQLYETEQPDSIAIVLQSGSLNELIEQLQLLNEIGRQDQRIAEQIAQVKVDVRSARVRTARTKAKVTALTRKLAAKTAEQRAARDAVVGRHHELEDARTSKQELLASVREQRRENVEDLEALLAASAEIAAKIQAAQAAAAAAAASGSPAVGSGAAPAGGFVWPLQGVLTSGFGPRWGRIHEGIDIAAPTGTPIVAAAAGTVIFAGWLGGYGNLTIIDHGDGVATAYGHQSALYVFSGSVGQGQAIGAVGSTGNSTGPHLHFEVRINSAPVDPLGYL